MAMATELPAFLTTEGTARELGVSRITVWRACQRFPGFAIRFGKDHRVPREHVLAVKAGRRPADIAAEARARACGETAAA